MDLTYDNNGNLTHFTHDYVYNWKNQLVKVITGSGVNVEYKYDALGRRIVKKVNAPNSSETVTRYVHVGYQVIEERNGSDRVTYRYTYGNGIDERIRIEKPYEDENNNVEWKSYLPIHDSIGNVTDLANDKGHIIESYNYSPYGEVTYFNSESAPGIDTITIENGKIKIRFDRPVDLNSLIINFYIKVTQTPIIGEIGSYDMERGVLVTPSQLPENEGLNLTIKAPDEIGGTGEPVQLFSKDFIYQGEETKTLHDQGPPRVERIMYVTNAFHIDFNEPIDPSSVSPTDNVEITYGSTTIKGSIEITGDNRIKFTPEELLSTDRSYDIDVKDIKDYGGKALVLFHYNFELNTYEELLFSYSVLAENTKSAYGNNSLMHGRTYEPEVGLYYYRNRYYHPKLGRFLQQDPMGYTDSMNLYQAFGMNPINRTDPFGLDSDAGRIASSLSKYYESIRPKNPGPSWFDRLLGKIAVTGFQFIRDVDNIDTGHFTLQTLYDTGNFLTLGTLERTAAQKDLDIGDKIWYFYNELPKRINNAGTFGLLDNLAAERGNGLEGAGRAVYKTLFDLSPASDIYTIFHTDAGIEEKIRAGGFFTSKIASFGLMMNLMNPGGVSSSGYLSKSTTSSGLVYDLTQVADDAFVHVTTKEGAQAILRGGLDPTYSGYVTKWKYVKDVNNPKLFNTKIYSQSLWKSKVGKFDKGAYILEINPIENPKYYSPFTNKVNGFPQWLFQGKIIEPNRIGLIKIIPGGN
jgi:RHS repeat-associated protein